MGKKTSKRHQKIYKMKGCSKNKKNKTSKNRSRKYLGGSDSNLAYTGEPIKTQSNPFLAYTGKGGSADSINLLAKYDIMNPNYNPYGANPALPNTGPIFLGKSTIPTNLGAQLQLGGTCGACSNVMQPNVMTGGRMKGGRMKGGSCGSCSNVMTGGNCGCGLLSGGKRRKIQKGGQTIDPQGLLGQPWGSVPAKWPGVDGISGNRNYLPYNNFKVDPQNSIINVGANPPFLYGGKSKSKTKRRKQKGGSTSNLLSQDLFNLGRQVQLGIGNTYNALNGYPSATPVLPWQGQLPRTPNLNTIRGAAL